MKGFNTRFRSHIGESAVMPIKESSNVPAPLKEVRRSYRSMFAEISQLSSCLMVDPLEDQEVYGAMG